MWCIAVNGTPFHGYVVQRIRTKFAERALSDAFPSMFTVQISDSRPTLLFLNANLKVTLVVLFLFINFLPFLM